MNHSSQTSSTRDVNRYLSSPLKHQAGSVLVFSLLIMLALTVLGVAGVGSSVTQERMAGGLRDRVNAFQAAEAALKRGQQFFNPLIGTAAFDGTNGLYSQSSTDPDIWADSTWTDQNSIGYLDPVVSVPTPTPLANVYAQPRFIIKYTGDIDASAKSSLNITGYGSGRGGNKVSNFRITARGVGAEFGSVVILETYFGKKL